MTFCDYIICNIWRFLTAKIDSGGVCNQLTVCIAYNLDSRTSAWTTFRAVPLSVGLADAPVAAYQLESCSAFIQCYAIIRGYSINQSDGPIRMKCWGATVNNCNREGGEEGRRCSSFDKSQMYWSWGGGSLTLTSWCSPTPLTISLASSLRWPANRVPHITRVCCFVSKKSAVAGVHTPVAGSNKRTTGNPCKEYRHSTQHTVQNKVYVRMYMRCIVLVATLVNNTINERYAF